MIEEEHPFFEKFCTKLHKKMCGSVNESDEKSDISCNEAMLRPDLSDEKGGRGGAIVDFLRGKSVFVTGATGFFGKILIEKLMRSCEEIETVFILVRPKKGMDIYSRIEEIYSDQVFSQLAKQQPKFRHKIVGVKGDVSLPGLGLSDSDKQLITDKVSLIYHAAATVRFDEKLKIAVAINVKGTKEILDLARCCQKLQSIVHVSTAFAHCPQKFIDEKFYAPPINTNDVFHLVDNSTDKEIEKITPKLLGKWPNTYAFTKAIAEDTVEKYGQGLPICVFRPSIVIATYKEPLRGWIDNLYGPTGVAVAAGTGVLRTLHCDPKVNAETVPVDYVVNALIAASYKNYKQKRDDIPIYNYVSSVEKPATWEDYMKLSKHHGLKTPTIKAIYYYSLTLNRNKYIHMLYMLFLHLLPAVLIDLTMTAMGKKARTLKLYKKIHRFMEVISYFSTQQWTFKNDNVQKLWDETGEDDRQIFAFSMKDFDWVEHAKTHMMGVRVFLIKDSLSSLPEARRKWRRLGLLHYTIQTTFALVALKLLYNILSSLF